MQLSKSNKQASKKLAKCSTQKSGKARKLAKPARVICIRPVDQAAAHAQRVQDQLKKLVDINAVYAASTLDIYADSEASLEEKRKAIRTNLRQVGVALGKWHCKALDLLYEARKLKANHHKELQSALAHFGGPKIN